MASGNGQNRRNAVKQHCRVISKEATMPKQSAKQRTFTRKQRIAAAQDKFQAGSNNFGPGLDIEYMDTPVKPECDDKDYRAIKLSNGLRVLLVADSIGVEQENRRFATSMTNRGRACQPGSTGSSYSDPGAVLCSLFVNGGRLNDPPKFPCVAEILCGVLCKASQKYPGPNRLSKLVEKSGGSLSTSDSGKATEFKFQVFEGHLEEAIDRFVECFVGPLLTLKDVAEKRDSIEMIKLDALATKTKDRSYERMDIFEFIASTVAGQPGNYFGPRYMEYLHKQLDEDYLEEVKKFMKLHYTAQRMTVILAGQLPLNTMEYYARTYFSKIPNNGLSPSDYTPGVYARFFENPEFRMIHWTRSKYEGPIEVRPDLELNWRMPSHASTYRTKPYFCLWWVLDNLHERSLTSYLKEKRWCTHLDFNNGPHYLLNNSAYAMMNVTLTLTDEGRKNKKRVLDIVFSYINFLRLEGLTKRIYVRTRKEADSGFRMISETPTRITNPSMLVFPSSEYLTGPALIFEYDEAVMNDFIGSITPERGNIIVYDHGLATTDDDDFDEISGGDSTRRSCAIPKDWIDDWKTIEPRPKLDPSEIDSYIGDDEHYEDYEDRVAPTSDDSPDCPSIIYSDDLTRISYKLDTKIRNQRAYVAFLLYNPIAGESAVSNFLVSMIGRMLLLNASYQSTIGDGFRGSFNPICNGLMFTINGPNQKILPLAKEIILSVGNVETDTTEHEFEAGRAGLCDWYVRKGMQHETFATEILNSITHSRYWTSSELVSVASTVDYNMFRTFAKRFMEQMWIDCLAYGNLTKDEVVKNVRECVTMLGYRALSRKTLSPMLIHEIQRGTRICTYTIKTWIPKTAVVVNYYQCRDRSIRQIVMMKLLCEFVVDESVHKRYHIYITEPVHISVSCLDNFGYNISIKKSQQSGTAARKLVLSLDREIEVYRNKLNLLFQILTSDEWTDLKTSWIRIFEKPDISMNDKFNGHVREMLTERLMFDRRQRELEILKATTIEDLRRSMLDLTSNGPDMGKLSVRVISDSETIEQPDKNRPMSYNAKLAAQRKVSTDLTNDNTLPLDLNAYKRTLPTLPFMDVAAMDELAKAMGIDCNVH